MFKEECFTLRSSVESNMADIGEVMLPAAAAAEAAKAAAAAAAAIAAGAGAAAGVGSGGRSKRRQRKQGFRSDLTLNTDPTRRRTLGSTVVVDFVITCAGVRAPKRHCSPLRKNAAGTVIGGEVRPQGQAAQEAASENLKLREYGRRYDLSTMRFYPFAAETHGFMHEQGVQVLREIAKLQVKLWERKAKAGLTRAMPYGTRFRRIVECMSASLQRGNALMIKAYRRQAGLVGVG